jgi:hypothetical protein
MWSRRMFVVIVLFGGFSAAGQEVAATPPKGDADVSLLSEGTYYKGPNGWVRIEPLTMAGGGAKHVGKMLVPGLTPQMVWTFRGAEAPVRIAEPKPTFYVRVSPYMIKLGLMGPDFEPRGKTQEGIDIEAENPTAGEIAFVQVKSSAAQDVLDDYVDRFNQRRDRYALLPSPSLDIAVFLNVSPALATRYLDCQPKQNRSAMWEIVREPTKWTRFI